MDAKIPPQKQSTPQTSTPMQTTPASTSSSLEGLNNGRVSSRGQLSFLQRTIGNRATTRLIAQRETAPAQEASAPTGATSFAVSAEMQAEMDTDVDRIVAYLKEDDSDPSNHSMILNVLTYWQIMDRATLHDGSRSSTPILDKFLLKLKTRGFEHSAWYQPGERHSLAFDYLFSVLKQPHLGQFKAIVNSSDKQKQDAPDGTAIGPGSADFWAKLGKQEAMGIFAMLGGFTKAAVGLTMDAPAWLMVKMMRAAGLPVENPASAAEWIAKQYQLSGDGMFGEDYTQGDALIMGKNAAQIGDAGGGLIFQMALIGAGASSATIELASTRFAVSGGVAALNMMAAGKGVEDSVKAIEKLIDSEQKRLKALKPPQTLSASKLLTNADFLSLCATTAASIFGVIAAGFSLTTSGNSAATSKTLQEAMARLGYYFAGLQLSGQIGQIIDVALSEKPEKEKATALADLIVAAAGTSLGFIPGETANMQIGGEPAPAALPPNGNEPAQLPPHSNDAPVEQVMQSLPEGSPQAEAAQEAAQVAQEETLTTEQIEVVLGEDTPVEAAYPDEGTMQIADQPPVNQGSPSPEQPTISEQPSPLSESETPAPQESVPLQSVSPDQVFEEVKNPARSSDNIEDPKKAGMNEEQNTAKQSTTENPHPVLTREFLTQMLSVTSGDVIPAEILTQMKILMKTTNSTLPGTRVAFMEMLNNNRVRPMTEEAYIAAFGESVGKADFADAIQKGSIGQAYSGDPPLIFIKMNRPLMDVCSTLVHELTHASQTREQNRFEAIMNEGTGAFQPTKFPQLNMPDWHAEIEAQFHQRHFLRELAKETGVLPTTNDNTILMNATDQEIVARTKKLWGFEVPGEVHPEITEDKIISQIIELILRENYR